MSGDERPRGFTVNADGDVDVFGDGTLYLPRPQVVALGRLMFEHADAGPSHWHMNDCGCCACFHPAGATDRGYIVNADGDVDYVEGHE